MDTSPFDSSPFDSPSLSSSPAIPPPGTYDYAPGCVMGGIFGGSSGVMGGIFGPTPRVAGAVVPVLTPTRSVIIPSGSVWDADPYECLVLA